MIHIEWRYRLQLCLAVVALSLAAGAHAAPRGGAQAVEADTAEVERDGGHDYEDEEGEGVLDGYAEEEREAAIEHASNALEALDKRIATTQKWLEENWEWLDQAARDHGESAMKTLRDQRGQAAKWFEDLRSGSADTWEEVKAGFSDAYARLWATWERTSEEVVENGDENGERDESGAPHNADAMR